MALSAELGYRWNTARILNNLGQTLHALDAAAEARQAFLEALAEATQEQTTPDMLAAMLGIATVLGSQGMAEQSMEICLHPLQHPRSSRQIKARAERLRVGLEARLSPQQISMIAERVHATPFETAVAGLLQGNHERHR